MGSRCPQEWVVDSVLDLRVRLFHRLLRPPLRYSQPQNTGDSNKLESENQTSAYQVVFNLKTTGRKRIKLEEFSD